MVTVMVVEDDRELRELFCTVLGDAGYETVGASCADEALEVLERVHVGALVSDVMMPGMDGFELVRSLRRVGWDLPILVVTAKDTQANKCEGFRAGVDDYMVKPVDVNELVWRVEALLRRARIYAERKVSVGATTLDSDALLVRRGDAEVTLPQKEFFLLFKLLSAPGRIFTRRQLLDEVWGLDMEVDSHTLDVHVSRLRERLRDNPDFEIVTVRGLGYKAVARG